MKNKVRVQLLLTKELNQQIKKIAQNNKISQSAVVRKLLQQSLAMPELSKLSSQESSPQANYVYNLDEFNLNNPRITGFKEIYSVGGRTTNVKVLSDSLFRFYEKNKKLPAQALELITKYAQELKEESETKKLVVRRAYVVPGLENPPGPRFLGVSPEDVVKTITKVLDFAIRHGYGKKAASQISVIFYPFADPKPLQTPVAAQVKLPYGGCAIPLNKEASRVEVLAVWGNNEGVQSFDAIDRYIVDADKQVIMEKNVPQKDLMLATTVSQESDQIEVPINKQFEQVLSDAEILESARIIKELKDKYGLRRVEFSYDGRDSLIYNECIPYTIIDRKPVTINKKGKIFTVKTADDVDKIKGFSKLKVEQTIVYIDKSIVTNRSYDILNSIAALSKKLTVLYPGLSATAHAMRVLNDFGHSAITVGNRKFAHNEEVMIKTDQEGQIQIIRQKSRRLAKYAVNLFDAKLYGNRLVGGKAMNLSILKSKGFSVPHGLVLTTNFFDKTVLAAVGAKEYKRLISGQNQASQKILNGKFKLDSKMWSSIAQNFSIDRDKKYAVRSSATVEDQKEHSFAGQFASYLNVEPDKIEDAVVNVIRSTFSSQVVKYLSALNKQLALKMAVVVHEMVDADKSGVIFGKDIQTGNEDNIIIDLASGLGSGVVDGVAKTQRIVYSKNRDKIVAMNKGRAKALFSEAEVKALIKMSRSIEQLMGGPQDIEWALDKQGKLWVLQSRDI